MTTPTDGSQVTTSTVPVTGTTEPGATVDVSAYAGDADGATTTVTTTAGADGSYSVDVPTPFGTNFITVAATTNIRTGRAASRACPTSSRAPRCWTSTTRPVTTTAPARTPTRRAPTSTMGIRHRAFPGHRRGRTGLPEDDGARSLADVRQPTRRSARRHLHPRPAVADVLDRGALRQSQLRHRRGLGMVATNRGRRIRRTAVRVARRLGSGSRHGDRQRRVPGHHGDRAEAPGQPGSGWCSRSCSTGRTGSPSIALARSPPRHRTSCSASAPPVDVADLRRGSPRPSRRRWM